MRPVGASRPQFIGLKVRLIRENLRLSHSAAEQFQQQFDEVPQPTHTRLAVADLWINGDPL